MSLSVRDCVSEVFSVFDILEVAYRRREKSSQKRWSEESHRLFSSRGDFSAQASSSSERLMFLWFLVLVLGGRGRERAARQTAGPRCPAFAHPESFLGAQSSRALKFPVAWNALSHAERSFVSLCGR